MNPHVKVTVKHGYGLS